MSRSRPCFNFESGHAITKRGVNIPSSEVTSAAAATGQSQCGEQGTIVRRMSWSFRVARVFGIDVRLHAGFVLTIGYFSLGFALTSGPRGAAFGVLASGAWFVCLLLRELGHSLVARRLGLTVQEILLLPISGLSRFGSEPRKPRHELAIALAGPLVNASLALLLFTTLHGLHSPPQLRNLTELGRPSLLMLIQLLFWGNAALAAFNALPGLPMDGGRVLRAALSSRLGRDRATRIAAAAGQVIAIGLVAWALRDDAWLLAVVGAFVFMGAARERAAVRTGELLSELRAGEVCDPAAVVFAPHEQVGHVLDTLVRCAQSHFAVFHGKELVGTVTRDEALALAPRIGLQAPVSALMRREIYAVDAGAPLDEVRRRLLELGGRPLVIRALNGYAGVLGFEDLRRIAGVAERLAQAGIRRPQPEPDPALH